MTTLRLAAATLCWALMWASSASAGEPQWWTDQKARCGLPSDLAYNSWDGSCGGGGQVAPPVVVYDPLPDTQARFQAVLGRVLRAVPDLPVSGLDIGSMEGIADAAGRTFVAARYRYDTLVVHNAAARGDVDRGAGALAALTAREQALQAEVAVPAPGLEGPLAELRTEQGYVAAWDARTEAVADLTAQFNTRSDAAAESIVHWFTVAVPPDARLLPPAILGHRRKAEVIPPSPGPIAVRPIVVPLPARLRPLLLPLPGPAPAGGADGAIAAIAALVPELEGAVANDRHYRRERARLDGLVAGAQRRVEAAEAVKRAAAAPLEAVNGQIAVARDRWVSAAGDGWRTGANLLDAAVETQILEAFRDDVVVPEIKSFLEDNGYFDPLDDSLVGQMYRDGRFVFEATAERYESLARLVDVARQARQVVEDFETYAQAAIDANAAPGSAPAFALLRDNAGLLDNQTWTLMEAAVGGTGPLARIGREMLQR
jgi:hypothetical protein